MKKITRRNFTQIVGAGSAAVSLLACGQKSQTGVKNTKNDWKKADEIRHEITQPVFPDRSFSLLDYHSEQEGTDYSLAFEKAIQACSSSGGGKVIVPEGTFMTGPIHFLSNVNLHLEQGAIVKFYVDPNRYLPPVFTRWEGIELMGYSPLIYAYEQENIAITGKGVIDGSANNSTWWPWKGAHERAAWEIIDGQTQIPARNKLVADGENGVPVEERIYADGAFLRPPLIQPYKTDTILIEGVTLKDSPFWLLNPVLCKNVTVKSVKFESLGPNSDGCNPESCDHVLIDSCFFNNGDDCIAIKSGRNADGRRIATPSKNIVISNCKMSSGHGGVVIGSEISGGVNNVFVENCEMSSPSLKRAIRIKTNSVRGGVIEHLRYRNINVGTVQNGVVINYFYEEGDAGEFDPLVRDIVIENLNIATVLDRPFNIQGFSRNKIKDIHIHDSHFIKADSEKSIVKNVENYSLDNVVIGSVPIPSEAFLTN